MVVLCTVIRYALAGLLGLLVLDFFSRVYESWLKSVTPGSAEAVED